MLEHIRVYLDSMYSPPGDRQLKSYHTILQHNAMPVSAQLLSLSVSV